MSSRGWALGYAGGGLVLAINFAVVTLHEQIGISEGLAVRLSMLMASVWWAGFTFVPWLRLRHHPPLHAGLEAFLSRVVAGQRVPQQHPAVQLPRLAVQRVGEQGGGTVRAPFRHDYSWVSFWDGTVPLDLRTDDGALVLGNATDWAPDVDRVSLSPLQTGAENSQVG